MKKVFKKALLLFMCFAMLFSIASISASAESGTISIGYSGSTNPGKEITVKLTVGYSKGLYAYDTLVTYDKDYLQLVSLTNTDNGVVANAAGSFRISLFNASAPKTLVCEMKFKLKKVGNTSIGIAASAAGDVNAQEVSIPQKSLSLSIKEPTKSSDNTLKSIKISAGTLSPAFSPNVTEYKVTVPNSVDYFSIDGYKNHSGATVKYTDGPGPNIKVGTTVRVITVTAENGAVKKYNITVTRLPADTTSSSTSSNDTSSTTSTVEPEENKLETSVDGNKMTVAEIIPEDVTAAGFTKGEYTFNSVHVPAFLDSDGKVVLLYLLNEENEGALYLYDSATGLFKKPVTVSGSKNYTIIPLNSITRDQILIDTESVFNLSTVTVGEQEVEAYVYKDEKLSDFAVVCAINEDGEKGFYRYDTKEGTLQRYVAEYRESDKTSAKVNGLVLNDTIVVISCAAACIVAIIAILIIWAVRRKRFAQDDFEDDFDDAEPLFVSETEFDANDEVENFAEDEDTDENDQTDGENGTEEE